MIRILKKTGILLFVFLLGVIGTALLLNSESTDNRSEQVLMMLHFQKLW